MSAGNFTAFNNTSAEEILKHDVDNVTFHFDSQEDAFRGCNQLKKVHDVCFNNWFQTVYLAGKATDSEYNKSIAACERETKMYHKCVAAKMDKLGIDLLSKSNLAKDRSP